MREIRNSPSFVAARCAAIEPLEQRQMLAAQPLAGAALDAMGTLVITGTRRPDVINVALNAADNTVLDVTLNGVTTSFNLADVLDIRATGGKGGDDIRIDAGVSLDAELHGGNGKDNLVGGSGDDLLHGGNGSDDLDGGAGDDDCLGGNGKDQLAGGDGSDDLHGGRGSDDLDGGDGDDNLSGEGGRDNSYGGAGSDDFDDEDEVDDMEEGEDLLIPYAELPAAVRAAFELLFAGATAEEVELEDDHGGLQYELEFHDANGAEIEVTMDAAGNVLV